MSKNVASNKYFLNLLLSTSKEQALALLYTPTNEQLLLLQEIAFNILKLPLPKKAQHYVSKKRKLFQRLASGKLSNSIRRSIIEKNADYILQVLLALRQQLNEIQ